MKTLAPLICFIVSQIIFSGKVSAIGTFDFSDNDIATGIPSDTLTLKTLYDSAKFYVRTDPILSKNILQKLIQIAQNEKNDQLHEYYNMYGTANVFLGNFEEAKSYYTLSLKINQQRKDTLEQIRLHNNLGYAYYVSGNYELSLNHYHIGLEMLSNKLMNKTLPPLIKPFGNKTPEQLFTFFYGNIARIHVKTGNYRDAIQNYSRALSYAEKDENLYYAANYLNELATLYTEIQEYDVALKYCRKAIEVNKEIDNQLGIGVNYQTLGEIYSRKDKIENAEIFLDKGLEIIERSEDLPSKANALFSKIRFQLKTRQLNQVQQNLNACYDIAQNTGDLNILKNYHFYQFQLDSIKGDVKNALGNFVMYHNLNSQLFELQKNRRIAELQMLYESQRKEQELELLSKENEVQRITINKSRNRLYFIAGVFSLVFIIGYLLMLYQKLRIKHKVVELKQKNLNQQMNPHFVYNCLNSIQSYIFQNDINRSVDYLSKFAKLMRNILLSSQQEYMTLHDEAEQLSLYLELESMRFKGKFNYTIKVDEKIDPHYYKIPTLLIQPFVENSLWHGIQNKPGKGHINIEFSLATNHLFCSIEDNGIGRAKAAQIKNEYQKNHHSLGTRITSDRMKLLRILYGNKLEIKYIDLINDMNKPAGTRVEINLPILN